MNFIKITRQQFNDAVEKGFIVLGYSLINNVQVLIEVENNSYLKYFESNDIETCVFSSGDFTKLAKNNFL